MILKDPPINIKDYENQEKNASRIKVCADIGRIYPTITQ